MSIINFKNLPSALLGHTIALIGLIATVALLTIFDFGNIGPASIIAGPLVLIGIAIIFAASNSPARRISQIVAAIGIIGAIAYIGINGINGIGISAISNIVIGSIVMIAIAVIWAIWITSLRQSRVT